MIATLHNQEEITIGYTNYRGEYSVRRILPIRLWVGETKYHPDRQLILTALDLDKNEERDFAVKDFSILQPSAA